LMSFLGIILRVLRLEVTVYIVYILPGGGGVKSVVEVTLNSKEDNYLRFYPNYVQEFGLWTRVMHTYVRRHRVINSLCIVQQPWILLPWEIPERLPGHSRKLTWLAMSDLTRADG
jgi:hypothetical protein